MAIDREIRLLLQYAYLPVEDSASNPAKTPQQQRVPVGEIYTKLRQVSYQNVLPLVKIADINLAELLSLLAEASVHQHDFQTAKEAVTWFLSDCRLKNQFYCRIQCVRAQCGVFDAKNDVGPIKLKKILNAIRYVLLVLPVALDPKKRSQYDFLIYNASVTYWHIARELMKKSTFQHLIPSLVSFIDALKTVGEKDILWISRLQIALIHAFLDGKQLASAAKLVNEAVDTLIPYSNDPNYSSNEQFRALYEELYRIQIHLGSFKDPECQKILPIVKKNAVTKRASSLLKFQILKSGIVQAETFPSALVELLQEATNLPSLSLTTSDDELKTLLSTIATSTIGLFDLEIILEVGIFAGFNGHYRLCVISDQIISFKGSKRLSPYHRVLHMVLKAVRVAFSPLQDTSEALLSEKQRQVNFLSKRIEAIKVLERALMASKRLEEDAPERAHLVEQIVIYTWNIGLPLFQKHLRNHVARILILASTMLEENNSLLLNLRVKLHLENAKSELASDFLAKAQTHLHKALHLDYGLEGQEESKRSLDGFLSVLKNQIDLKETAGMNEEEIAAIGQKEVQDQAQILIEQAKENTNPKQKKLLLQRAYEIISKIIIPENQMSTTTTSKTMTWVFLWAEIAKIASCSKLDFLIAKKAAFTVMQFIKTKNKNTTTFTMENLVDKTLWVVYVDMIYILVDIAANELLLLQATENSQQTIQNNIFFKKKKNLFVLGFFTEENENINKQKKQIILWFQEALEISKKLEIQFVLENTCVFIWNFHFHVFQTLIHEEKEKTIIIFQELLTLFENCFQALDTLPLKLPHEIELFVCFSEALCIFYSTHQGNNNDDPKTAGEKIMSICDLMFKKKKIGTISFSILNLIQQKRLMEIKAKYQLQVLSTNTKEYLPTETLGSLKIIGFLEAINFFLFQKQNEKANFHFQKAMNLWSMVRTNEIMPNIAQTLEEEQAKIEFQAEVWTRLAFGALMLDQIQIAIECTDQAIDLLKKQQNMNTVTETSWKWFALGEIICGQAILALSSSTSATATTTTDVTNSTEKIVPELVHAALEHFVSASNFATKGNAPMIIKKAVQCGWNASILPVEETTNTWVHHTNRKTTSTTSDPTSPREEETHKQRVVQFLRTLLQRLAVTVSRSNPGSIDSEKLAGKMVLFCLDQYTHDHSYQEAIRFCDEALNTLVLSSPIQKEIAQFKIICSANLGTTNGASLQPQPIKSIKGALSTTKEPKDPILQSKILKKVAVASANDPAAQLKALCSAYKELDHEAFVCEQTLFLVDFGEWFLTQNFAHEEFISYLLIAIRRLEKQNTIEHRNTPIGKFELNGPDGSEGPTSSSWTLLNRHASSSNDNNGAVNGIKHSCVWYADMNVRLFSMLATMAKSYEDRVKCVQLACGHVQKALDAIFRTSNDAFLQEMYQKEIHLNTNGTFPEFEVWKQTQVTTSLPHTKFPFQMNQWHSYLVQKFQQQQQNSSTISSMPNDFLGDVILDEIRGTGKNDFVSPSMSCHLLEKLLGFLIQMGVYEWTLPVLLLHQVIARFGLEQKSKCLNLWYILTFARVLEPLMTPSDLLHTIVGYGLELLLTQGDLIVKELSSETVPFDAGSLSPGTRPPLSAEMANKRRLCAYVSMNHINVIEKTRENIDLLFFHGLHRQAKSLLTLVRQQSSLLRRLSWVTASWALLNEKEGKYPLACQSIRRALAIEGLDIPHYISYTIQYATILKKSKDYNGAIKALQNADTLCSQALVSQECAFLLKLSQIPSVSSIQSLPSTTTASRRISLANALTSSTTKWLWNGDLDVIHAIGELKSTLACFLFENLIYNRTEMAQEEKEKEDHYLFKAFEQAKTILFQTVDVLASINSHKWTSIWLERFVQIVFSMTTICTFSKSSLLVVKKISLDILLKSIHSLTLHHTMICQNIKEHGNLLAFNQQIAQIKNRIAAFSLEIFQDLIEKNQMQFDLYQIDSRRTIIEKWLNQTSTKASENTIALYQQANQLLPKSLVHATTAANLSRSHGERNEGPAHALAKTLEIKCLRLAKETFSRHFQQKHWTLYTSIKAPHTTWICVNQNQMEIILHMKKEEKENKENEENEENDMEESKIHIQQRLIQYQKISLESQDRELLTLTSEELINQMGCTKPLDSLKQLLIFQSTKANIFLEKQFEKCISSTNLQYLFLQKQKELNHFFTNAKTNSLAYQIAESFLEQKSETYKRLSLKIDLEFLLQNFSSITLGTTGLKILSLQLSENENFCYVGFFSANQITGSNPSGVVFGRMEMHFTKKKKLQDLLKRISSWRFGITKTILEYEEVPETSGEDFEFVPIKPISTMPPASTDSSIEEQRFSSNDTNGGGDGTSSTNTIHSDSRDGTLPPSHQQEEEEEEEEEENDKHRMEEDVLEEEMSHILEETWDFFKELFSHSAFENVLSEEQLAGSHLILLLDPIFDSLPMESLPCFHGADSISRDFSIYMLYYRLLALKAHPFKKEEIHYIVDPLHEDFGSVHPLQNHHQSSHVLSNKDKDNTTVSSILYQYTKKNGGPFTSWKEIVPDQAIYPIQPGPNEWQQGLLSCSKGGGFVYVGPNRVLSNIPPENIAGMNLTGCHLILTLGRCENYKSSRRQSKKDSEKTRVDLDREESIVLNALLSLCGVQTIVCNQWTTTFSANRRLVNGLFTNLAKGYSIGKALKKYGEQATPMEQSTTSSINNNNSTKKNQSTTKNLPLQLKNRIRYNPVVYGLAHLSLKQTKNA